MANEQNITVIETGPDGTEKEFEITTAKVEDLTGEDQSFAEAAVEAMFDEGSADQEASYLDYDGDGRLDTAAADTDGDGQLDTAVADTDGDGQIDAIGKDTDGDGNLDVIGLDTDGDGQVDAVLADTDGDGQIDTIDIDGDGVVDFSLEASEGLPTEEEISTNSIEFTVGEDGFPTAEEIAETTQYESYSEELEAMVEETTVTLNDDGTANTGGVEPAADPFVSTVGETETSSISDAATTQADAEAAALAEQQAHADAARAAQEAADEFVEKGDFKAAAEAREVAENEAYQAGDHSMLGTSDSSDLENAAWKQEIAEDYRQQQQENIEKGDYAAAREDAANAGYATGDADFLAGGPDRTGQSDKDVYNLDWAIHQEGNAEYYASSAEKYAQDGDFDNAARSAEQAGVYQASADEFASRADQESYNYHEDPTSLVETGGTYDPGMAGGYDAGAYDAGTAGGYDAGGFDASVASVDTGIDTSVDTSAASSFDTTTDV
ncbi:MAG TPA: hypothetical protein PKD26_03510 [Pyrinomonadaceae bacterium]|nr:hypothetical protein [Pyrinomonadaceae bacterium]